MDFIPFVRYCVEKLVEVPDAVEVERVTDGGDPQIRVRVAPDDTGKVIGRSGRIIGAMRQVVNVAAAKHGEQIYLKVVTD
ncbi:MAG: KH domain-containing protein [Fimbriimonadales bacterium]